jgi:hypothetical protein
MVQPLECCSEFSRVGGSHRGPASEISSVRRAYFKARLREARIPNILYDIPVFKTSAWSRRVRRLGRRLGEVHPLECRRGYYEVVDLTEGSARLGFREARVSRG